MDPRLRRADESGQATAKAAAALSRETEQLRRAEESLYAAEERFRLVADMAIEAIISADSGGRIIFWNPAAEAIFGYTAAEAQGQLVTRLMPEHYREQCRQGVERLRSGQDSRMMGRTVELQGLTKAGREVPLELSLATWTANGQSCYTAVVRDLTWRQRTAAEIAEASRRLADSREAERLYLAQELHDGPLQELHGVRMRLVQLAEAQTSGELQLAFAEVQDSLRNIIGRLRSICSDLRPPALSPFGLEVAIRSHAAQFQALHPELHLELDLEPDRQRLPERTRLALFRIYQHALANMAQHAEADHMRVVLKLDDQQVTLRIRDDGRGFEVPTGWLEPARGGHLGLLGASERAAAIGGELVVVSAPGEGTLVEVTAPLPAKPEAS